MTPDPTDPTDRRARRRQQTLDHVARTALSLFDAHGYDAVTMEQLAVAADVAKGTLYNHFPTKEAVLAHAMHLLLADDAPRLRATLDVPGTFEDRLHRLLTASAEWLQAHRAWLLPYFRHRFLHIDSDGPAESAEAPRDLSGVFAWLIAQGQADGTLRAEPPASHQAALLHHLYFGALMRWLTVPGRDLGAEFAVVVDLFLDGVRTRAPLSRRA